MGLRLVIQDFGGERRVVPLSESGAPVTLGRQKSNTVLLDERNVSRSHAQLCFDGETWSIEDTDSYNGVRVNGIMIDDSLKLTHGDIIQIGDYRILLGSQAQPIDDDFKALQAANELDFVQRSGPLPVFSNSLRSPSAWAATASNDADLLEDSAARSSTGSSRRRAWMGLGALLVVAVAVGYVGFYENPWLAQVLGPELGARYRDQVVEPLQGYRRSMEKLAGTQKINGDKEARPGAEQGGVDKDDLLADASDKPSGGVEAEEKAGGGETAGGGAGESPQVPGEELAAGAKPKPGVGAEGQQAPATAATAPNTPLLPDGDKPGKALNPAANPAESPAPGPGEQAGQPGPAGDAAAPAGEPQAPSLPATEAETPPEPGPSAPSEAQQDEEDLVLEEPDPGDDASASRRRKKLSAAEFRALVAQARQAGLEGKDRQAFVLARKSYLARPTQETLKLLGVSACKIGNRRQARHAITLLRKPEDRATLREVCAVKGLTLR